jgi:hypothetical protein
MPRAKGEPVEKHPIGSNWWCRTRLKRPENVLSTSKTGASKGYEGVFNRYLKADWPLYLCTDVETRHKNRCYQRQTGYAL